MSAGVQRRDVDGPGGFDQHREPVVEQHLGQAKRVGMHERLATGEFDKAGAEGLHLRDDLFQGHAVAAVKGIRRVAPHAPERTPGDSHKRAG